MSIARWPALLCLAAVAASPLSSPRAASVIVNEYNAVGNDDYIDSPTSSKQDSFWKRRQGNGQDWFELVVIQDLLDMRDWEILVRDRTGDPNEATHRILLSADPIWAGLRRGTILTFSERLPNNVEDYEPVVGGWWLNVRASAETAGTYATVECVSPACAPALADWSTGNTFTQITVRDPNGLVVFGPAGEGIAPAAGVGNNEVWKLEQTPTASITPFSTYNDGTTSTFGQPNAWTASGVPMVQDFSTLRSVVPYSPLTSVRINEVFSHSDPPAVDWVELVNTTGSPVNIGGWYLSQSYSDLTAYPIPGGTTIPAYGTLVFTESQLGFAFSSPCGDEVLLSVADPNGALTGQRDWASFGAVETGRSVGRPPDDGHKFVRLATATQGAANTTFVTGPVVINEIMYQPDPNDVTSVDPEFVELYNTSSSAVDLWQDFGGSGTFGWQLTGGIEFEFDVGTTMPAHSYLLVVPFDPVAETGKLVDFRATYGLSPSVPIVGPYTSTLGNFSDLLRLRKPDTPEADPDICGVGLGTGGVYVPRVIVDQVQYYDFGDWPSEPDGSGASLERRTPPGLGTNPDNWVANPNGGATPGAINAGAFAPVVPALSPGGAALLLCGLVAVGAALGRPRR
jgi:hypothetical protein